jgi:asparagine synthase (glutamine-hydrolysing)
LPDAIIRHRKQGFESPMAAWLRGELKDYARDILGPGRLGRHGLFDRDYVAARLDEHFTGRRKNNKLLFALIMFQEWYERRAA